MKTYNTIFKCITAITVLLVFTFSTNMNAQNNNRWQNNNNNRFGNNGRGIGGNNGATSEHSAYVNNNGNKGHAGEGNRGNGVGNMPYGNQGSNGNPNGRTGNKGDSIPLDGGLGILLIGAAALGVKKLRDNKNDKL